MLNDIGIIQAKLDRSVGWESDRGFIEAKLIGNSRDLHWQQLEGANPAESIGSLAEGGDGPQELGGELERKRATFLHGGSLKGRKKSAKQSSALLWRPALLGSCQEGLGCGCSEIRIQDVFGEDLEDLNVVSWDAT